MSTTPLDLAQDLVYDAWETSSKSQRVKLARQAIALSNDCADAYLILAEDLATTLEQRLSYCEQAVAAAERSIPPRRFEQDTGHFWGYIDTRPYMRARTFLAWNLRLMGETKAAIKHYRALLHLNSNDNQGLRYHLSHLLLEINDNYAAYRFLIRRDFRDDISAEWKYSKALVLFRLEGSNPTSTDYLHDAIHTNQFVPPYLLQRKQLPNQMPQSVGFGDEREAVTYTNDAIRLWQSTNGALTWLKATFDHIKFNNSVKPLLVSK